MPEWASSQLLDNFSDAIAPDNADAESFFKGAIFCHPRATPLDDPQLFLVAAGAHITLGQAGPIDPTAWLSFADVTADPPGLLCYSHRRPWAHVYSGVQFGAFTGPLGDGRCLSVGEVSSRPTHRRELQVKGIGRTPFSRQGDGWMALSATVGEFLMCELLAAVGIPTVAALCVLRSGTLRTRPGPSGEPRAVLGRAAPSFLRLGTLEHLYYSGQTGLLRRLVLWVGQTFYHSPDPHADDAAVALHFLSEFVRRTAALLAMWQAYGFVHGVLNTDNVSLHGVTLDAGTAVFLDVYDADTVASNLDHERLYRFSAQPRQGLAWCQRLAEALSPIVADHAALRGAVGTYDALFQCQYRCTMCTRLGIACDDIAAVDSALTTLTGILTKGQGQYNNVIRLLGEERDTRGPPSDALMAQFNAPYKSLAADLTHLLRDLAAVGIGLPPPVNPVIFLTPSLITAVTFLTATDPAGLVIVQSALQQPMVPCSSAMAIIADAVRKVADHPEYAFARRTCGCK